MSLARRPDPRRWQLHLARRGADGADHVRLLRDIDPDDAGVRSSIPGFHSAAAGTLGSGRVFGPVAGPLPVAGSIPASASGSPYGSALTTRGAVVLQSTLARGGRGGILPESVAPKCLQMPRSLPAVPALT